MLVQNVPETLVPERGFGAGGRGDEVELRQLHVCTIKTINNKDKLSIEERRNSQIKKQTNEYTLIL